MLTLACLCPERFFSYRYRSGAVMLRRLISLPVCWCVSVACFFGGWTVAAGAGRFRLLSTGRHFVELERFLYYRTALDGAVDLLTDVCANRVVGAVRGRSGRLETDAASAVAGGARAVVQYAVYRPAADVVASIARVGRRRRAILSAGRRRRDRRRLPDQRASLRSACAAAGGGEERARGGRAQ